MNNEIGRKLTSLTLMTIMLAGGMVIAAPSMVPTAAAAGALYVSAENAMFGSNLSQKYCPRSRQIKRFSKIELRSHTETPLKNVTAKPDF